MRLKIIDNTRQISIYTVLLFFLLSGCTKKEAGLSASSASGNLQQKKMAAGNISALAAVGQMSGNPILPSQSADPDMIFANGKYYIYTTANGPGASQFHCYSSSDLLAWTDEGIVLDLANVSWGHANGWAPSVVARNGNYYFYFTAEKKIGVAVGTSPTGPFVDKGSPLATGDGTDPIDPMVFIDNNGQAYMYWGNTTFNIQQLNTDMISLSGTRGHQKPSNYFEAPYVLKRNSTYYLMYSVKFYTDDDYHVEYATSSSPMGPWTTKGRITSPTGEIKGPGHNAVLRKPGCPEEYFFVYHRRNTTNVNQRQVAIDRMFFDSSGNIMPISISTSGVIKSPGSTACLSPNPITNGQYAIRSKMNTASGAGLYLDIPGCSNANADVKTWTKTTCNGQKWNLSYQGNGFYKIISEQPSHKSLDLVNCGIERGTDVVVFDALGNNCQLWRIESDGNGWYRLIARASNNVLDIEDASASPGANVRSWSWNATDAQLWKFETP
ncbi:family 43 glycosylhydrolase [Pedobacter mucosus]|uniref:family 43 glycosylhydrolase n=1 Tax=Pedobacter mucosus TaxID=2895286 RepID=UPI001EE4A76C|nr:family 43 glycosylhydrolase [Pedobacter mucosus]UKT65030.1 family 43 glycosylhydrolase [Pedobacter mucosus]